MRFLSLVVLALPALAQDSFVNWETPHVHPLAMTPDGTRLLAVNLADNRLEVFQLGSGSPVPELAVPVGLDPVSVRARTNTEAWVVNHVSDSISVVDLTTHNVVATLDTDDEPTDVVFAGSPERAFVSCSQANTVLVFDPADLGLAPTRIDIQGEDPRAMAVSPAGDEVYVAIFESGNQTTILGGGADPTAVLGFPPNVVSDPAGPYAGVNPPPNDGVSFDPPFNGALPPPPAVGLIVKQNAAGAWFDDNSGDWTSLVSGASAALSGRPTGWTLLDHDVAILDTGTLAVSYADHLMNINMAIGVNPSTGEVGVVGTEATNEIRFEPLLRGTFVRSILARVDPTGTVMPGRVDLNSHLSYAVPQVAQSERDKTLADPRGIEWNAAGTRAYVSGMGSNNVVVLDSSGTRTGLAPTIEVGEGPTGLALDEARQQLYVLNKFDASISIVDTTTELETTRVGFYDPTPAPIQTGRKHLYDAHETSGLGLTSCAACHVDARMDRLSWDLGDPAGDMKTVAGNLGANVPGLNTGFEDWHPMKGPMLTQTLQDIIRHEPHHWRGDRTGIEEFSGAFIGLLGDDETLTTTEMQEFEDFLDSIHFPPNPYRTQTNDLPTSLPLDEHFEPGLFGAAGSPLPSGNAVQGRNIYTPPRLLDNRGIACVSCHTFPTGMGTGRRLNLGNGRYQAIAPGPAGERHLALVAVDGLTNVTMKVPHLRNLYERTGFDMTQLENTAGFGYVHDGSVDSIARFLTEPVFTLANQTELANMVAFMLAFSGSNLPSGSNTNLLMPPGPLSQDAHALVGTQLTIDSTTPSAAQVALLDLMIARADLGEVGLVVKGRRDDLPRGWSYKGQNKFQSDRWCEIHTRPRLLAGAGPGNELTFTVVPLESEVRIGIDRDQDRSFDRDELDAGTDPADPTSRPKIRNVPKGKRF